MRTSFVGTPSEYEDILPDWRAAPAWRQQGDLSRMPKGGVFLFVPCVRFRIGLEAETVAIKFFY